MSNYLYSSINNIISKNTILQNTGGPGGDGYGSPGASGGVGCGIYLYSSANNTIFQNPISQNTGGQGGKGYSSGSGGMGGLGTEIHLISSTNNSILNNNISGSYGGAGGQEGDQPLWGSHYGRSGNGYGVYIDSNSYNNTIESSNTYNAEPIYYYYNQSGILIKNQTLTLTGAGSTNLGRIILINCQNFTIKNNSIACGKGENGETGVDYKQGGDGKTFAGIYLYQTNNGSITSNTISDNCGGEGGTGGYYAGAGQGGIGAGIYLSFCNEIVILNNTIRKNRGGYNGGLGCGVYTTNFSNISVNNNYIYNNRDYNGGKDYGYGIYNVGTVTFNAEYNWWTTNSGPYHPQTNPSGRGDRVSDWVDYKPWTIISSCFIYVDDDNTSGIEYGTLEYPYNTIQEGVEACPEEGTVSVTTGTYSEVIYINKNITLIGVGTPTIDGSELGDINLVTFDGTGTLISGFKITGVNKCGIYCGNSSPIITNNTISEKYYGIRCDSSSPTITNNTISKNNNYGIVIVYSSSPTITNNVILENSGGIYCYKSSPNIINNTILKNSINGIICKKSSNLSSFPQHS